jgi:hypothetical protein
VRKSLPRTQFHRSSPSIHSTKVTPGTCSSSSRCRPPTVQFRARAMGLPLLKITVDISIRTGRHLHCPASNLPLARNWPISLSRLAQAASATVALIISPITIISVVASRLETMECSSAGCRWLVGQGWGSWKPWMVPCLVDVLAVTGDIQKFEGWRA